MNFEQFTKKAVFEKPHWIVFIDGQRIVGSSKEELYRIYKQQQFQRELDQELDEQYKNNL